VAIAYIREYEFATAKAVKPVITSAIAIHAYMLRIRVATAFSE
jgi:hypothetical protein